MSKTSSAVAPIVPCRNQILDAIGAADRPKTGDDPIREVVPLLGVGAAAGFLAGLFGVGGGAGMGLRSGGPLAIIFGEISNRQLKRGERAGNTRGFSITGRICGWISFAAGATFLGIIVWVIFQA